VGRQYCSIELRVSGCRGSLFSPYDIGEWMNIFERA
jgi:hypothetical protein